MSKIGLFGGCFNPTSNIHVNLANNLLNNRYLDKVIFVPVGNYYPKDDLISANHRYNILKLATQDFKNIEIDDIILTSKNKLYATDSFKILAEKYKESNIYFIMGSDNFNKMPNWKDYKTIIKKYKYIIVERENFGNIIKRENVLYFQSEQKDISATQIRRMLKNDENVAELLNENVIQYIKTNNLYK